MALGTGQPSKYLEVFRVCLLVLVLVSLAFETSAAVLERVNRTPANRTQTNRTQVNRTGNLSQDSAGDLQRPRRRWRGGRSVSLMRLEDQDDESPMRALLTGRVDIDDSEDEDEDEDEDDEDDTGKKKKKRIECGPFSYKHKCKGADDKTKLGSMKKEACLKSCQQKVDGGEQGCCFWEDATFSSDKCYWLRGARKKKKGFINKPDMFKSKKKVHAYCHKKIKKKKKKKKKKDALGAASAGPPPKSESGCFPGSAQLSLADGRTWRLRDSLAQGAEIQSFVLDPAVLGGVALRPSVYTGDAHSHAWENLSEAREVFLEIMHQHMRTHRPLQLTPHHLVFLESEPYPVPAARVRVGDRLRALSDEVSRPVVLGSAVLRISAVEGIGLFAPQATSGRLFVESVAVSAYALPGRVSLALWDELPRGRGWVEPLGHLAMLPTATLSRLRMPGAWRLHAPPLQRAFEACAETLARACLGLLAFSACEPGAGGDRCWRRSATWRTRG